MKTIIFKNNYSKSEFYSLMGQFFAETEYKKELPYICNNPQMEWNVFVDKNTVVAFFSANITKDKCHIASVYVAKEHRKRGMLNKIANQIKKKYKKYNLWMMVNKDFLIEYWQKKGFEVVGTRGSYKKIVKESKKDEED